MSGRDKRLLVLVGLLSVVCLCLKLTTDDMADIAIKSKEKQIYVGDKVTLAKDTYTCKPGETIYTYYVYGSDTRLKSLTSGNRFVAGISQVAFEDFKGALCLSCKPIKINCRLKGTTTVSVNTKGGQKATAKVIVTKEPSTIKFDKNNIKCSAGQTVGVNITTDMNSRVESYSVDNTSIATVKKSSMQPKCPNCRRIDVVCKKQGSTTVRAYSNRGATTSAGLLVTSNSNNVVFEKSNIKCKKGDVVKTIIKSTDGKTRIKTFSSDDIAVAALSLSSAQPRTTGAIQVDVACRGNGSVTLRASNANGVVGTANVTVGNTVGTVSFEKATYTCRPGQSFETKVTADKATIKNILVEKTGVIKLGQPSKQLNCANCRLIKVECQKIGTSRIVASSSAGASGSALVNVVGIHTAPEY